MNFDGATTIPTTIPIFSSIRPFFLQILARQCSAAAWGIRHLGERSARVGWSGRGASAGTRSVFSISDKTLLPEDVTCDAGIVLRGLSNVVGHGGRDGVLVAQLFFIKPLAQAPPCILTTGPSDPTFGIVLVAKHRYSRGYQPIQCATVAAHLYVPATLPKLPRDGEHMGTGELWALMQIDS